MMEKDLGLMRAKPEETTASSQRRSPRSGGGTARGGLDADRPRALAFAAAGALASASEWRFGVARGGALPDRRDVPLQRVGSSCLVRLRI
jgi:hypothetical protein